MSQSIISRIKATNYLQTYLEIVFDDQINFKDHEEKIRTEANLKALINRILATILLQAKAIAAGISIGQKILKTKNGSTIKIFLKSTGTVVYEKLQKILSKSGFVETDIAFFKIQGVVASEMKIPSGRFFRLNSSSQI